MASRRNVVFDMGNVLMTFDGHEFARAFVGCEEDARTLYEGTFGRVEWSLLDSGTIDHQTMLRVALAHTPSDYTQASAECLARWPEHSRVIEPHQRPRAAPARGRLGRLRALQRLGPHRGAA